jgi:hypothetical protein
MCTEEKALKLKLKRLQYNHLPAVTMVFLH